MKKIYNLLFGIIIFFAITIIILNFTGFKTTRVISSSMSPKIHKHSLALVKELKEDDILEIGDVIAFTVNGKLVLHEIISLNGDEIITQGIRNKYPDAPISSQEVVGVYIFSIPILGLLFASIYPWIIIILLVLGYYFIVQLRKEFNKNRGGIDE